MSSKTTKTTKTAAKTAAVASTVATEAVKEAVKEVAAPTPAPAAVPTPAPVAAAPSEEAAPAVAEKSLDEEFTALVSGLREELKTARTQLQSAEGRIKQLEKLFAKAQKSAGKRKRGAKAAAEGGVKKAPSGFAKPTAISPALAKFLNLPEGSLISRTQATKEITKYVKEHSLATGRNINPDATLKGLLKLSDTDKLTYFNLASFMKIHFVSAPKA